LFEGCDDVLGRVVWSALVVKWSASPIASSFGFTVLDVGVDHSIFLISYQICVDLISANFLHHVSHSCFFREKSLLISGWQKTKFFSLSFFRLVDLKDFGELAYLVRSFSSFWREKERVDWVVYVCKAMNI
jgi:hypothetical protein